MAFDSVGPGTVIFLSAFGLFIIVFAAWSIRHHIRRKSEFKKQVLPQVSYYKPDPVLRHSLYSCKNLDITNPRDSTHSLTLSDHRYSAPPPAYSRPSSRRSSIVQPLDTKSSLTALRQSIYADDGIFDGPRNSSTASLVPSRVGTPTSSRAQSMCIPESSPSLAALRLSIYGDSNPVFAHARNSSQSLPLQRPHSLSPTRFNPRYSSQDLANVRGRLPSGSMPDLTHPFEGFDIPKRRPASLSPVGHTFRRPSFDTMSLRSQQLSASPADIRHSLYSDSSPLTANPNNPGFSPFNPRSRNASATNLTLINNRFSCPSLSPSNRSISTYSDYAPTPSPGSRFSSTPLHNKWEGFEDTRSTAGTLRPRTGGQMSEVYNQTPTQERIQYQMRKSMDPAPWPETYMDNNVLYPVPQPVYAPVPQRRSSLLPTPLDVAGRRKSGLMFPDTGRDFQPPSTGTLRLGDKDDFGELAEYFQSFGREIPGETGK